MNPSNPTFETQGSSDPQAMKDLLGDIIQWLQGLRSSDTSLDGEKVEDIIKAAQRAQDHLSQEPKASVDQQTPADAVDAVDEFDAVDAVDAGDAVDAVDAVDEFDEFNALIAAEGDHDASDVSGEGDVSTEGEAENYEAPHLIDQPSRLTAKGDDMKPPRDYQSTLRLIYNLMNAYANENVFVDADKPEDRGNVYKFIPPVEPSDSDGGQGVVAFVETANISGHLLPGYVKAAIAEAKNENPDIQIDFDGVEKALLNKAKPLDVSPVLSFTETRDELHRFVQRFKSWKGSEAAKDLAEEEHGDAFKSYVKPELDALSEVYRIDQAKLSKEAGDNGVDHDYLVMSEDVLMERAKRFPSQAVVNANFKTLLDQAYNKDWDLSADKLDGEFVNALTQAFSGMAFSTDRKDRALLYVSDLLSTQPYQQKAWKKKSVLSNFKMLIGDEASGVYVDDHFELPVLGRDDLKKAIREVEKLYRQNLNFQIAGKFYKAFPNYSFDTLEYTPDEKANPDSRVGKDGPNKPAAKVFKEGVLQDCKLGAAADIHSYVGSHAISGSVLTEALQGFKVEDFKPQCLKDLKKSGPSENDVTEGAEAKQETVTPDVVQAFQEEVVGGHELDTKPGQSKKKGFFAKAFNFVSQALPKVLPKFLLSLGVVTLVPTFGIAGVGAALLTPLLIGAGSAGLQCGSDYVHHRKESAGEAFWTKSRAGKYAKTGAISAAIAGVAGGIGLGINQYALGGSGLCASDMCDAEGAEWRTWGTDMFSANAATDSVSATPPTDSVSADADSVSADADSVSADAAESLGSVDFDKALAMDEVQSVLADYGVKGEELANQGHRILSEMTESMVQNFINSPLDPTAKMLFEDNLSVTLDDLISADIAILSDKLNNGTLDDEDWTDYTVKAVQYLYDLVHVDDATPDPQTPANDVQTSTLDPQTSTNDVQMSTNDVQTSTNDVQTSTNDVQTSTNDATHGAPLDPQTPANDPQMPKISDTFFANAPAGVQAYLLETGALSEEQMLKFGRALDAVGLGGINLGFNDSVFSDPSGESLRHNAPSFRGGIGSDKFSVNGELLFTNLG